MGRTKHSWHVSDKSLIVVRDHLDFFVARHWRYRCDEKRKRVGDVVPNGSFIPPLGVIAPSSAERFDKQLGGPIDLKVPALGGAFFGL